MAVDGDPEDGDAGASRLHDGVPGVLDPEAPFVVVDVVRLAVGQDEEKLLSVGTLHQPCGRVAYGGADPGVVSGLQRADAPQDAVSERLVEILHGLDPDP